MPDRICGCGKTLSFSRSPLCRGCRAAAEKRKQSEIRELKRKQRRFDGFVIAHSCTLPTDSFDPAACTCKKYIKDRSEITRLMSGGEAVDLETRKENYALDVTDIILTGKRRQVPRASGLSQAHIERATQNFHTETEKVAVEEAAFIEAPFIEAPIIEEDDDPKFWIEEYGRINRDVLQSLVKEYSAEEYDRIRQEQWGRQWSSGISEKLQRNDGSVGKNVVRPRLLVVPENAPISPELRKLIEEQRRDNAKKIVD